MVFFLIKTSLGADPCDYGITCDHPPHTITPLPNHYLTPPTNLLPTMSTTTSTTLAFPKPYLQCLSQTNNVAVQHLATLLQMPMLEQAWAYTTTDALRDTEQLLVMSTFTHSLDKASKAVIYQMSYGLDYPRHYARWMVLEYAKASLVQLASEHLDAVKACADKLIAMVPQAELEAPPVSLRHTFAPEDTPWLEGRTFVLTGELSEMDREAALSLIHI